MLIMWIDVIRLILLTVYINISKSMRCHVAVRHDFLQTATFVVDQVKAKGSSCAITQSGACEIYS